MKDYKKTEKNINPKQIDFVTIFIRGAGIAVLLTGLYFGGCVVSQAWKLLENREIVVKLSDEIEQDSHINSYFKISNQSQLAKRAAQIRAKQIEAEVQTSIDISNPVTDDNPDMKPSYFIAWGVIFLILMTIGKIALWTISAGSRLASYSPESRQYKKLIKDLVLEIKAARGDAETEK